MAHGKNGDEGRDAEEIQERSLVQDQVVVHAREREHQNKPDGEPAHLLPMHACERAAVGGRINLNHAKGADGGEDGEQPPVVVARAGRVFHEKSPPLTADSRQSEEKIDKGAAH